MPTTEAAERIRARAIQRSGELLKQIEDARGGDRRSEEFKNGWSPDQGKGKGRGRKKKAAELDDLAGAAPSGEQEEGDVRPRFLREGEEERDAA